MTHGVLGLDEPATTTRRRVTRGLVPTVIATVAVFVATFFLAFGGPSRSTAPVTEAEARAHLDRAVRAALAHDFDGMCALNGSVFNCRTDLDAGDRDTVPTAAPTTVAARYTEKQSDDGTPGWILTVTGQNGRGKPYSTEVMVFRDHEGNLAAINIVWWSGNRLVLGDSNEQKPD